MFNYGRGRRTKLHTLHEHRARLETVLAAKTVERQQLPAVLRDLRATPVGAAAIADTIVEAADIVVERLTLRLLELDG